MERTEPETLQALNAFAGDEDVSVHKAAAGALQGVSDREALQALIGLLRDEDWEVRGAAAHALRGVSQREALQALIAPAGSGVAQLLSAAAQRGDLPADARDLIFVRLLRDDVPFADWPEG